MDNTCDTFDLSDLSRLSHKSYQSAKTSLGGVSEDIWLQDNQFSLLKAVKLFSILKWKIKEKFNSSFALLKSQSSKHNLKRPRKIPKRNCSNFGLYHKRLILNKVITQMVLTGHKKLMQRPFWIWKMIIPKNSIKKPYSMKSNTQILCRILINRFQKHYESVLKLIFSRIWPKKVESFFSLRGQMHEFRIKPLKSLVKKRIKNFFLTLKDSNLDIKKMKFLMLSTFIQKRLRQAWNFWIVEYEYEYQEEIYEPVNTIKVQVKNFYVTNKPCVPIYFYDIHTYVPAFQATVHNLNHFLKRKIRVYFKTWAGESYRPPSITSLYSYNSPKELSLDHSVYILNEECLLKLQKILTVLVLIHQKRTEMPKLNLCKWLESCNIQNLKINRLLFIILNNQKKNEKKRISFNKIARNSSRFIEFTDII